MLIERSLLYHWRAYAAVLLGVMITTTVLVGSLLMGDVVSHSLHRIADQRLGRARLAVISMGDNFGAGLAGRLEPELERRVGGSVIVAPVMQLRGVASVRGSDARSRQVRIYAVDDSFWRLAPKPPPDFDGYGVNRQLADRLGLLAEDGSLRDLGELEDLILRVSKPSWISRDAAMSSDKKADVTLRLSGAIGAVIEDEELGRFDLAANQVPPDNVYIPLAALDVDPEIAGMANLFLSGTPDGNRVTTETFDAAVDAVWRAEDLGLIVRESEPTGCVEIRSRRLFLRAERLVEPLSDQAQAVLTYLVNDISRGTARCPYSMVAAVEPELFRVAGGPEEAPAEWGEDEILINRWLADDIGAGLGDGLKLTYWVMGRRRQLDTEQADFSVAGVLPLREGTPTVDSDLMPDFPGIAGKPSCSQWDSSYPIDIDRFGDEDNAYWDEYGGTPKAFITLAAGRRLWRNRFGNATALRFYDRDVAAVRELLHKRVDPRTYGLVARDVAGMAENAAGQAMNFGHLFLLMSFFLIAAALLLTALLFTLAVDRRRTEMGLLKALGLTAKQIRRRLMLEALMVAVLGTLLGLGTGVLYSYGLFQVLTTGLVRAAVGGTGLVFWISPLSLVIGAGAVLAVVAGVLALTLRHAAAQQAAGLLRGTRASDARHQSSSLATRLVVPSAAVVGIILALIASPDPSGAPFFFGAGACLLVAGIAGSTWLLRGLGARRTHRQRGLGGLALLNAARRPGRSLAVVGILAAAVFLVVSVGSFHKDADFADAGRSSGTGGFDFWGTTSLPVYKDLNSEDGRREFRLRSSRLPVDFSVLAMRTNAGDNASCLNLNRSQMPRLWGVDSSRLAELGAFSFASVRDEAAGEDTAAAWRQLGRPLPDGSVPAVVDQNTALWAMKVGVGDRLDYPTDGGGTVEMTIVGLVSDSILQGGMLVDEWVFEEYFTAASGYRTFLIDAGDADGARPSADKMAALRAELEQRLRDVGLVLTRTRDKLAAQYAMQNVYLAMFQVLGGLGLLLGSLGLGVILLRNVIERQRELAIMRSIGFGKRRLGLLLILEHTFLLVLGAGAGLLAAAVAVVPMLMTPDRPLAVGMVAAMLGIIVLVGLITIVITGLWAMRGNLVAALRSE